MVLFINKSVLFISWWRAVCFCFCGGVAVGGAVALGGFFFIFKSVVQFSKRHFSLSRGFCFCVVVGFSFAVAVALWWAVRRVQAVSFLIFIWRGFLLPWCCVWLNAVRLPKPTQSFALCVLRFRGAKR